MTNLGMPVLRVQAGRDDYLAKPGGGGAKAPLVAVTPELRAKLQTDLQSAFDSFPDLVRLEGRPGVLIVELREAAWAKSNRPNSFFASMGMAVGAVERVGELLVPVTRPHIEALKRRVGDAVTKGDLYSLSTIERFTAWDEDHVFSDPEWHPAETDGAAPAGRRFRIQLFPWVQELPPELGRHGNVEASALSLSNGFLYLDADGFNDIAELAQVPEIRHIELSPQYMAPHEIGLQSFQIVAGGVPASFAELTPEGPLVGVIDSGISSGYVEAHVSDRTVYELPPDTDHLHGTFVGGLIIAPKILNQSDARFPADRCQLVDVVALSTTLIDEGVLLQRVEEAVDRHPDVRVWNCSFASSQANHPAQFGAFAAALDQLSDKKNVLFVVAAGNYSSEHCREWPDTLPHYPGDRVAMPGESIRALTVGAVVPFDCTVPVGSPAPYSRRGPGPAFSVKPEVVHYGGGVDASWNISGGVRSVLPGDVYAEGVGTSFSTPIVSAIAANTWATLEASGLIGNPSLVKALTLHAAALNSGVRSVEERHYFGHGIPLGSVSALFCRPDTFTLLFEANLRQGVDWAKDEYPIPDCLKTADGKFRGEVIITMCYPSPCDIKFGEEYVQHEVEMSFGTFDLDFSEDPPRRKQSGKVPPDRPPGLNSREKAQLEDGLKFSSSKVYRKRFSNGCAGDQWRLKLSLTRRLEIAESFIQPVYVLVSLRALEPDLPVYNDGLRVLPAKWTVNNLVAPIQAVTRVRI
ncbi:S8 family peptidase [Xanthomonas euvesicatoria]|uniref:S8 family peptidase n=1 Tax=Xanthomonas euvesicatoria TaxID=456327 RepID=UPI0035573426